LPISTGEPKQPSNPISPFIQSLFRENIPPPQDSLHGDHGPQNVQ